MLALCLSPLCCGNCRALPSGPSVPAPALVIGTCSGLSKHLPSLRSRAEASSLSAFSACRPCGRGYGSGGDAKGDFGMKAQGLPSWKGTRETEVFLPQRQGGGGQQSDHSLRHTARSRITGTGARAGHAGGQGDCCVDGGPAKVRGGRHPGRKGPACASPGGKAGRWSGPWAEFIHVPPAAGCSRRIWPGWSQGFKRPQPQPHPRHCVGTEKRRERRCAMLQSGRGRW